MKDLALSLWFVVCRLSFVVSFGKNVRIALACSCLLKGPITTVGVAVSPFLFWPRTMEQVQSHFLRD